MKVTFERVPQFGLPIHSVPSGTIVMRACAEASAAYLVVNLMNGTGHHALVSMHSGVVKEVPQDEQVIPMQSTLTVGRELSVEELIRA